MKTKALIPFLLLVLCSFNSQSTGSGKENPLIKGGLVHEEYDPLYFARFQSVDAVIADAEQKFGKNNRSLELYNHVAGILRKRFYHGYSYYNFSDNAVAYVSGLAWDHLSAIVIPDDIMKHPMAACSQQAIVLMEIFRRTNIDYRKIGYKNHFVVEGFIDNEWRYFDTNIEPDIMNNRQSLEKMIASNSLEKAYRKTNLSSDKIKNWSTDHAYGIINEEPAANATMFHKFGFWIQSKIVFILFIIASLAWVHLYIRKRKPGQALKA